MSNLEFTAIIAVASIFAGLFGILLLILTPVTRVAFSVFAFWRQRDRLYIIVTLIVLVIFVHGLLTTE